MMACGLDILESAVKLVAFVVLVMILLKLTFVLERWGKK